MNTNSCPINIDAAGRRARVITGLAALAVAVGLGLYMIQAGAPKSMRLATGAPLFFGALGLLQAKEKTCVVLAARNSRILGKGMERVTDADEARRLRQQGMYVLLMSIAIGVLGAVGFWLLPI